MVKIEREDLSTTAQAAAYRLVLGNAGTCATTCASTNVCLCVVNFCVSACIVDECGSAYAVR